MAVGIRTKHWTALIEAYLDIFNCSMDVRYALGLEWDETVNEGTGMDEHVRDRMKKKDMWQVLIEVATFILAQFNILLVVCNHGKHRSLALVY